MNESALTPELLALMEHEKVIEQNLDAAGDVLWALNDIRQRSLYRARGFESFDDYCRSWWGDRWIKLAPVELRRELVAEKRAEGKSLRTISAELGIDPKTAHADLAIVEKSTTGAMPDRIVGKGGKNYPARREPPKKEHPATFSEPILARIADHLREAGHGEHSTVLDPFAGIGGVHHLRERVDVKTVGVEIEPEWAAKHPDTVEGNALELTNQFPPETVDAIATSPTYGNRMADHHNAKDDSVRLTYKHTLGRDLHDDNSGSLQWGDEYRNFHQVAWAEAEAALKPGGTLTLNIKNHIRDGVVQRVAEWHINTLLGLGLILEALDAIPTGGLMAGENSGKRLEVEYEITFRKPNRDR